MRQLSLDPSTAELTLRDVPQPAAPAGGILVRTAYSVISTGTELTKVDLAGKSLLDKARERPDQVAKVLAAVKTEGIVATVRKVRERLASPQPLGYSLAGTVVSIGESCEGFAVGMRVACGGASASHAEFVAVPGNLAVPVPDGVPLDEAAFATIGSVALHGLALRERLHWRPGSGHRPGTCGPALRTSLRGGRRARLRAGSKVGPGCPGTRGRRGAW